jgi:hypothetical protein
MTRKGAHCMVCDSPVSMKWEDALAFDCERILCSECSPSVSTPRVHLFGAPDNQDLGRWSDMEYEPREEEVLGVVLSDPANPFLS